MFQWNILHTFLPPRAALRYSMPSQNLTWRYIADQLDLIFKSKLDLTIYRVCHSAWCSRTTLKQTMYSLFSHRILIFIHLNICLVIFCRKNIVCKVLVDAHEHVVQNVPNTKTFTVEFPIKWSAAGRGASRAFFKKIVSYRNLSFCDFAEFWLGFQVKNMHLGPKPWHRIQKPWHRNFFQDYFDFFPFPR